MHTLQAELNFDFELQRTIIYYKAYYKYGMQ